MVSGMVKLRECGGLLRLVWDPFGLEGLGGVDESLGDLSDLGRDASGLRSTRSIIGNTGETGGGGEVHGEGRKKERMKEDGGVGNACQSKQVGVGRVG